MSFPPRLKQPTKTPSQMTRSYMTASLLPFRTILLQFSHMWKVKIHKFPTSFPQKRGVFPHSLHIWKSDQHLGNPQEVFHNPDRIPGKTCTSMWKTMWKVWKISTGGKAAESTCSGFPPVDFRMDVEKIRFPKILSGLVFARHDNLSGRTV